MTSTTPTHAKATRPPPFFPQGLARLDADCSGHAHRLLVLDFDGTLAPIAPTPEAAAMPTPIRHALQSIRRMPRTQIAVLSGRSLADLQQKVSLPGILYSGNHGMTFSRPSLAWDRKQFAIWRRSSHEVVRLLKPLVESWKGARLESKGPDVSLHYRLSPPQDTLRLVPKALKLVQKLPLQARHGKCVLEFRPTGSPGKGDAILRIANRYPGWRRDGLCVYMGDDTTDEDAFRALRKLGRNTLGLKVGGGPTAAHYHLRSKKEVLRFLEWFLGAGRN
jgi:trehalose-phosphatase